MDKAKIAQGLSLLVNAKSFVQRVRQINEIVDGWEDTPLLFGGTLEPLNALVDVGLSNREAMTKLIDLAQSKRQQVPVAKRVDYQRHLMREKRERLYKAVELEELVRGASLKGDARKKYMFALQAKWMHERNEFIATKGDLSWKERNEAANLFWRQLDTKLEHDLAEARVVLDKPPLKRKRKVELAPARKPVTALSKAFDKASSMKQSK